ncbi:MAG: OmpH family outer membrane protein [Flavobacteriaceae bacterium]|nr:OmpH family outer membrane protein [Flavobacteriaceae bacterium]
MRKLIINLFVVLFFISLSNCLVAQELKIGFVQKQFLVNNLGAKEGIRQKLDSGRNALYQRYQLTQRANTQKITQLVDQRKKATSSSEQQRITQQIEGLQLNTQEEREKIELDYQTLEKKAVDDLILKVDNAIAEVVKTKKIKHLLTQSSGNGESVILYADQQTNATYNITLEVAKLLGLTTN